MHTKNPQKQNNRKSETVKNVKVISSCNINKFICILYFIVFPKVSTKLIHALTDWYYINMDARKGGGTNIFIKFLLYIMLCIFFYPSTPSLPPLRPLYMSTYMQPQPLLPALRNDVVTRSIWGFHVQENPF